MFSPRHAPSTCHGTERFVDTTRRNITLPLNALGWVMLLLEVLAHPTTRTARIIATGCNDGGTALKPNASNHYLQLHPRRLYGHIHRRKDLDYDPTGPLPMLHSLPIPELSQLQHKHHPPWGSLSIHNLNIAQSLTPHLLTPLR